MVSVENKRKVFCYFQYLADLRIKLGCEKVEYNGFTVVIVLNVRGRVVGAVVDSVSDVLELASMAKLKSGRLTREVADTCLQFWGGMGFTWDNRVSRLYRDGRLGSIGGGADEVMLGIIGKTMGLIKRQAH